MVAFQGESKKRTDQDIKDLAQSLQQDGLLQPLSIWCKPDDKSLKILDGHGRKAALEYLSTKDPSIIEQQFPFNLFIADTEEEAIKACLQMMSTCGKVSKVGVKKFAAPVINTGYKAPIVTKAIAPVNIKAKDVLESSKVVISIEVSKDKVSQLISILKDVEGVNVCV